MLRIFCLLFGGFISIQVLAATGSGTSTDWQTTAERTGFTQTGAYDATVAYARHLAEASPEIQLDTIGKSADGRDIPALIASSSPLASPAAARASGKNIVLVVAGMHANELCGKDAGFALLRDMVINKSRAGLLQRNIVIFIPALNVDGLARFGSYNQINQNGPEKTGWRTTAQNYNLSRDFMKADTLEMRAFLQFFNRWLPDLMIDIHSKGGADYQYDITWSLPTYQTMAPSVIAWEKQAFINTIFPALAHAGHKVAPYIDFRDPKDPMKGFDAFPDPSQSSTGFGALQNRPVLLMAMHMLKPYRVRVKGAYDALVSTLNYLDQHPRGLQTAVHQADEKLMAAGTRYDGRRKMPLALKLTDKSVPFSFQGNDYATTLSPISGSVWIQYLPNKPRTFTIPFYNKVVVDQEITPPLGYIVPAWMASVIRRLQWHGIHFERLQTQQFVKIGTYQFSDIHFADHPEEGHVRINSFKLKPVTRTVTYPAGSAVVYLDQRTAKIAVNMLEPESPDSLLRWGYMDTIFEQKEYVDPRVLEKMGRKMLEQDPALAREFAARIANDSKFAADPESRLDFFYQRSPYFDSRLDIYPIGRLYSRLKTNATTPPSKATPAGSNR